MQIKNALSGLVQLRDALSEELASLEAYIDLFRTTPKVGQDIDVESDFEVYHAACAQLRSGIASVDEALGWLHYTAAEELPDQPCNDTIPRLYLVPKNR